MGEPIYYDTFSDLFYLMGIDPHEFKQLSGKNVAGFYPKMSNRKPKVDVKELANLLWRNYQAVDNK